MTRIVDLSVPLSKGIPSPPSINRQIEMQTWYRGPTHWQSTLITMLLHTGSHVDFPRHCEADGETAGDTPLDKACGDAIVLHIPDAGPSHEITISDLARYEHLLKPGQIVLVRTDWADRMWGNFPSFYLDSPYCSPQAIKWLMERGPKAVGFDCFCEYPARLPEFDSEDFKIHKAIFEGGGLLFQILTGLSQLPVAEPVPFFAGFLRIDGAEGVPARFFAVLPDSQAA